MTLKAVVLKAFISDTHHYIWCLQLCQHQVILYGTS